MHDWLVPCLPVAQSGNTTNASSSVGAPDLGYRVAVHDGFHDLGFGDTITFRACLNDKVISLASGFDEDPATLDHLLYDHVLPRVLSASATLVLHGSLVLTSYGAAVFMGDTGAGKSTLGASLHARGDALLGDDAVIVTGRNGRFYGEAVYPSLRLYPDSIRQVFGNTADTIPMACYSAKRHVSSFRASAGAPGPLPITCIFVLEGAVDHPTLRRVSARESCMAIIDQSFALCPENVNAARQRLAAATNITSAVPAFALGNPHDYAALPLVHRLIDSAMADCASKAEGASISNQAN